MKKLTGLLIIISFLSCGVAKKTTVEKQVGVLSDAKKIAVNKTKLKAGDANLSIAYQYLIKEADAALKIAPMSVMEKKHVPPSGDKHDYMSLAPYHWPDPEKKDGLPYIRKDGQTNPEVKEYLDKQYMPQMIGLVQTLAQAYYFSGQERYASHAALLLKTWFLNPETRMNPNLNFAQAIKGVNTGRGAGLIDARHLIKVIDAVGFIQQSKHWQPQDQEGMEQWFGSFLHWMETSDNGLHELKTQNNHGTWYDAQRLAFALFIDSTAKAKTIVASALNRLDEQMDNAGYFPREMARTMSLHYAAFNLEAFFLIAQMAEYVDIDVWNHTSTEGKSLSKAFNVLKPYLMNEQPWAGQQIRPFDFEEDAYFLLAQADNKLGCVNCKAVIQQLPGKKEKQLRYYLLF
jgi:hypothetical protein